MNSVAASIVSSAAAQAALWDARARVWAEVQQHVARPLFLAVLKRTSVSAGDDLLDVG